MQGEPAVLRRFTTSGVSNGGSVELVIADLLDESEMPTQWYNMVADLPEPPPPALHPGTHEPAGPDDFAPLFPMALIEQEVNRQRYVDIPGGVLDVYRLWRPSPLFRARRRRTTMQIWGATVHPSPSEVTDYGRSLLAQDPDQPGSIGIAISEAVSMAVADPSTRYALGSVLNPRAAAPEHHR